MDSEERGGPARIAPSELQRDELDAGAAVAAVAAASPVGGQGGTASGFGAKDVAMMLRQRAEWFEQLGKGAVICSEDLSDTSSEWDGSNAPGSGAADVVEQPKSLAAMASAALLEAIENGFVIQEPLDFSRARRRFAGPGGAGDGAVHGKLDPPSRLQRLYKEAEALCGWAEAHGAGVGAGGMEPLAEEAGRLRRGAGELADLATAAAATAGALPQQVWLPPSEHLDVAAVQQLLMLNLVAAAAAGHEEPSRGAAEAVGGGLVYQLSAAARGGWRADAEAEALRGLGERLARLRTALGAEPVPAGGSLAGAATCLHQRLDTFLQVSDPDSCGQLSASVRLLAAEVEAAAAEARHLEALEAEEREADSSAGHAEEETAAERVAKLHERLASLDAVALRAAEVEGRLAEREVLASELARLANDIASAEARTLHAGQVLRAAAEAAERMRQAAEGSREQLARSAAALEAKLAVLAPAELPAG